MIKVVYDPLALIQHPEGHISLISEYPQLIKRFLNYLDKGESQTIIVINSVILQWLKNMANRFPQDTFIFETIDAREALTRLWNVDITTNVTNEDIQQAYLLSLDIRPQAGFNFEDIVLAYYYSPIFTSKTFPFTQLAKLLDEVKPEQWKINLAIPLLPRLLNARLEEWKSNARTSEQRQLVELFATDPPGLKLMLMRYRVLASYPSIGEALLGKAFDTFKALKLQMEDFKVEETQIPETVLQVTYYLKNQKIKTSVDLAILLDRMSGMLAVEFDTIEKHLHKFPEWITLDLLEKVEEKFSSQSRQTERKIAALRMLIRPPKPETPEINWDVETMLSWATSTYLPYQAWCNRQEQFEPDLFTIGDRFSEWLMKNWDDIHANSKRMVFNIFPNKAIDLKRERVINLVLVIDNLGWSFSEILRDLFKERGYFLASAEPYLAMLPSETEISKKCLLAGEVGYQAIDDKNYKGMIEKGWVPYYKDDAFRYISDLGGLGTIELIDAKTYVVNYLAADKALHQSAAEIGMPHHEHIHHLLEKVVKNTEDFIEKHNLQERIRIHVVADHGSTRIPESVQNDLDILFFKTKGFEVRSHRYVTVSNEQFNELADNLRMDCFFLPAHEFLNPQNVLCARRGNRFIQTDKNSYVHGGLLPEEIIVPYMVFEHPTKAVENLTVLLKNNEFRYRMEMVELEVGNPNDTIVEQIHISLPNGNVESEPVRIALLDGKTNTTIKIQARFKLTNIIEEQDNLRIRVRFKSQGEQHTFDVHAKIKMRKMVEEKKTSVFDD